MSPTESLTIPDAYKYFPRRFETIPYIASIAVAVIYVPIDYFILISYFTPAFRYFAALAYLFPLSVSLITGIHYFVNGKRPSTLQKLNIAGFITFLVFHFFPFYFEKTDDLKILSLFLLFQIILCSPYIVAQVLVLLSFSLKTLQPMQGAGTLYSIKPSKVNRPGRVWFILFAFMIIFTYYSQSLMLFILAFLMLYNSLDMQNKKWQQIYVTTNGLVFYSSKDKRTITWQDITRISLKRGFINMNIIKGAYFATNKENDHFAFTITSDVDNYKELIPLIINNCDHLGKDNMNNILKDFETNHAD